MEGRPESTVAAVNELAHYLIGKDPLRIEHHWQHIYRSAFYRGGPVLMTALSGIDQALWDIAGKHYAVPVYQLLGGAVRDRVRVYAHWGIGDLSDEGKAAARGRLKRLQSKGYTAFKSGPGGMWRPCIPDGDRGCDRRGDACGCGGGNHRKGANGPDRDCRTHRAGA